MARNIFNQIGADGREKLVVISCPECNDTRLITYMTRSGGETSYQWITEWDEAECKPSRMWGKTPWSTRQLETNYFCHSHGFNGWITPVVHAYTIDLPEEIWLENF